jgi:hypothetical protein
MSYILGRAVIRVQHFIVLLLFVVFSVNRSRIQGNISISTAGALLEAMVALLNHGLSESFRK